MAGGAAHDYNNTIKRLIGEDKNLTCLPAPDLWPLKIDPSQINQLLANLCINARDANAEGSQGEMVLVMEDEEAILN